MFQIDHVLCPVDLSECSGRAIRYASAWARKHGAELHVLHVVPLPVPAPGMAGIVTVLEQRPISEIRSDVEQFVRAIPNLGVQVDVQVRQGDARKIILAEATRWPNTLLVVGAHEHRGLERFVRGSVTARVSHDTPVPTLVVPPLDFGKPDAPPVFRRILCAVDFLPSSLEGLRAAIALCKEAHAELTIVHVLEDVVADAFSPLSYAVPEYEHYRRDDALRELRAQVPEQLQKGCTIRAQVVAGEPAKAVARLARDLGAELVITGAGDRYHLRSLWLGTTTSRIVRDMGCPVLVVPAPAALMRAVVDATRSVARDAWHETVDRITREHQGDPATVMIMSPGLTVREVRALPLIGITFDTDETRHTERMTVFVGTPSGGHLSHVVTQPTELLLDESGTSFPVRLLIRAEEGTTTLVDIGKARRKLVEPLAVGSSHA
jgi:universal stress protein A